MNRRWICNDVWMDIFRCFNRPQLGFKLALISPRFNSLVDKHFDFQPELTIWNSITIRKNSVTSAPESSVFIDEPKSVPFPLPDRPLPSKIRFKCLQIRYIDHSVIAFLRSNQHLFDKRGTNLELSWISSPHTTDGQQIWDIFVREIWPIFASKIRHLGFTGGYLLDNLRRRTSPTILTDLNQLSSINSVDLLPAAFGGYFDGPNATISAGQALYKWLNTPRKDGQPKQLRCEDYNKEADNNWINNFKQAFMRATTNSSVCYEIHFTVRSPSMPMMPFELVNESTKEKLTLAKAKKTDNWIMKRCKIGKTAAVQLQKLNNVFIWLFSGTNCIGPLSPPPAEDEA